MAADLRASPGSLMFTSLVLSPKTLFVPSFQIAKHRHHSCLSFKIKISCSPHALSGDHYLLSTTEHSDGSIIFRFGDASELAKNVEVDKHGEDGVEIIENEIFSTEGEIIVNQEGERCGSDATEFVDSVNEAGGIGEGFKSDRGIGMSERLLEDVKSCDESYSVGVGLETHVDTEECSDEMISFRILTPVSLSQLNSVVKGERIDLGLDMVSIQEKDGESASQSASSVSDINEVLEPNGFSSKDGSKEEVNVEMDHKGDLFQVVPEFNSLEVEAILDKEITHNAMYVEFGTDGDESLQKSDGNVLSLNSKEEIAESNKHRSNNAELLICHEVELQTATGAMIREETSVTELFLSSGFALLPHPSKALTGRKDAYFVDQNWLGIVDGVGKWCLEGINVGHCAQELIENCGKIVYDSKSIPITDPVEVLNKAAMEAKSPGLAAALIAYFDGQALHVANIGDSGFVIVRNGTIFRRSTQAVHEFNFPVQIEMGNDHSELIEGYIIDLEEGDAIIVASNGLFDNLYEQEIASFVSKSLQARLKPQEIAQLLATSAQEVGQSSSARSPFADAAQAAGYVGYTGGKLDDVTVIVSFVQNRSNIPMQ